MFSLSAECNTRQDAEHFSRHFDNDTLELSGGSQTHCLTEVVQDSDGNWWCQVFLSDFDLTWSNREEGAFKVLQSVQLENIFYECLKSAPIFRYALVGEGVDRLITSRESPGTSRKLLEGDIPLIAYLQGIVLSEEIFGGLNSPLKAFQPFSPGYVWIPPRGKCI
jgi:hypothetical protein